MGQNALLTKGKNNYTKSGGYCKDCKGVLNIPAKPVWSKPHRFFVDSSNELAHRQEVVERGRRLMKMPKDKNR